jgi:hypothetical protein
MWAGKGPSSPRPPRSVLWRYVPFLCPLPCPVVIINDGRRTTTTHHTPSNQPHVLRPTASGGEQPSLAPPCGDCEIAAVASLSLAKDEAVGTLTPIDASRTSLPSPVRQLWIVLLCCYPFAEWLVCAQSILYKASWTPCQDGDETSLTSCVPPPPPPSTDDHTRRPRQLPGSVGDC